ncbi:MAG: sigma-54-dependent Fis family transcriptional regulator [candidate division Zixibacteria bacterium]|nr:sigma-54-dependent Fis family transcriptional regulator [candidate division Zixibacteria bacterium]
MSKNILVIDDERKMTVLIENALNNEGFVVTSSNSSESALKLIEEHSYDIIITDLSMPKVTGIDILEKAKQKGGGDVILMTAFGSVESAVQAMKNGAADYIQKPFPMDELVILCQRLSEKQALSGLSKLMAGDLKNLTSDNFIGKSSAAANMLDMISKVAPTDTSVLLYGRSGTGKELAARMVHENSTRKDKPFIAVNCAALTETLLESELFGHEKGAFTGAVSQKRGRFELADSGTIFLDEIGETSAALQTKLLRVLEERQFVRVGGVDNVEVDVRIIAATNRNLKEEIKNGNFREDLYFRLNVFPVEIPTLVERIDDVKELSEYFLKKKKYAFPDLSDESLGLLKSYDWPGNIRELKNILERAMILASGKKIEIEHIGIEDETERAPLDVDFSKDSSSGLEDAEKHMIEDALKKAGGNKTDAAKLLKITRRRLYSRMKYHSIGGH